METICPIVHFYLHRHAEGSACTQPTWKPQNEVAQSGPVHHGLWEANKGSRLSTWHSQKHSNVLKRTPFECHKGCPESPNHHHLPTNHWTSSGQRKIPTTDPIPRKNERHPSEIPLCTNLWQNFGGQRNPQRTTPSTQAPSRPLYNSTTTPRTYNNQPVPMDLSCTQGNRGQGQWQYWGNTTSTSQPTKGNCYNCGIAGHFSWDCWKPKRTRAATIQQTEQAPTKTNDNTTLIDWDPKDNKTTVVQSTAWAFLAMSPEDRRDIIAQIGAGESQDFQTAWSTWPWSGLLDQNMYTCQIVSLCQ